MFNRKKIVPRKIRNHSRVCPACLSSFFCYGRGGWRFILNVCAQYHLCSGKYPATVIHLPLVDRILRPVGYSICAISGLVGDIFQERFLIVNQKQPSFPSGLFLEVSMGYSATSISLAYLPCSWPTPFTRCMVTVRSKIPAKTTKGSAIFGRKYISVPR